MATEIPYITEMFRQLGLESLTEWATQMILQGATDDELSIELYKRPEFRSRFRGYFMLQEKGLPLYSIEEILDYERTVFALAYQWRMPITLDDVQELIGNNVSARETGERIELSANAVYNSPQATRSELNRLYGIDDGQLTRAFLDPQKEFPKLQTMYGAATLAGTAATAGWGNLTVGQAERLYQSGLTPDRAQSGFGELYKMRGLFDSTNAAERWITPEDQLTLLEGNAALEQEVEKRQRTRKAEFARGGTATETQQGLTGYGSAD